MLYIYLDYHRVQNMQSQSRKTCANRSVVSNEDTNGYVTILMCKSFDTMDSASSGVCFLWLALELVGARGLASGRDARSWNKQPG